MSFSPTMWILPEAVQPFKLASGLAKSESTLLCSAHCEAVSVLRHRRRWLAAGVLSTELVLVLVLVLLSCRAGVRLGAGNPADSPRPIPSASFL
ncbi:hypothetical protein BS50DRAFT_570508 [Corynespora cassiicola Philippines]|uniref:Uncharacterized protein n=1 Tax=Corynespora cassiicola Philippines TaxID=1448308 RepID=A0A2T2P097_CORCC|nr:hypothetical protein BS50DRAFT_570508 [Corynespora cassiicola Philippines]